MVLAIVTALGGRTSRDITLNAHPIRWVVDSVNLWIAIVWAVTVFISCRHFTYPRRLMLVLDAAGLALFAIPCAEMAQAVGASPGIVVMMACITGCARGMIRDVLTRAIPMVLLRDGELYANCALVGAVFDVVVSGLLDQRLLAAAAMLIIFSCRIAAIFGKPHLPDSSSPDTISSHPMPRGNHERKPAGLR